MKAPSEPPGVVSLSHLKSLPIPQQVFCSDNNNNNNNNNSNNYNNNNNNNNNNN